MRKEALRVTCTQTILHPENCSSANEYKYINYFWVSLPLQRAEVQVEWESSVMLTIWLLHIVKETNFVSLNGADRKTENLVWGTIICLDLFMLLHLGLLIPFSCVWANLSPSSNQLPDQGTSASLSCPVFWRADITLEWDKMHPASVIWTLIMQPKLAAIGTQHHQWWERGTSRKWCTAAPEYKLEGKYAFLHKSCRWVKSFRCWSPDI